MSHLQLHYGLFARDIGCRLSLLTIRKDDRVHDNDSLHQPGDSKLQPRSFDLHSMLLLLWLLCSLLKSVSNLRTVGCRRSTGTVLLRAGRHMYSYRRLFQAWTHSFTTLGYSLADNRCMLISLTMRAWTTLVIMVSCWASQAVKMTSGHIHICRPGQVASSRDAVVTGDARLAWWYICAAHTALGIYAVYAVVGVLGYVFAPASPGSTYANLADAVQ